MTNYNMEPEIYVRKSRDGIGYMFLRVTFWPTIRRILLTERSDIKGLTIGHLCLERGFWAAMGPPESPHGLALVDKCTDASGKYIPVHP